MAKKKYKKKNTAGKVIAGLSIGTILCGATAGVIYTLEQNPVSASQPQEGTSDIVNDDLQNKIDELEQSKTELQTKIDKLTSDKTALEATITENEAVIGSLNNQIETLDKEITTLRVEKLALEEANETNLEAIAGLNASIETLENERATLQIELDLKEETLSSLQAEVESLRQQVAELSQGNYSLSIENTNTTMTRADYNYKGMIFDDVISLDSNGETIPFETSHQMIESTNDYEKYIVYHFNGTSENGDYAIRYLTVLNDNLFLSIKGVEINKFNALENKTLYYEDFELVNLTKYFNAVNNVIINIYSNGTYLENLEAEGESFTMEEGKYYNLEITYELANEEGCQNNSDRYTISTSTTGVYRINWGENISINSSGMADDGNYVINFDGNGFENMKLEIKGAAIDAAINGDFWQLEYEGIKAITTDGTEFNVQGSGHGIDNRIKNMNTIIYTTNGDINLCLDLSYIFNEYQEWEESNLEDDTNDSGIVVTNVEYFENGKAFEDTPAVTNIYKDGEYVVFDFNAFNQIGNKLYFCMGNGEGYVVLADGDTETAVVSLESNSDNEAVINIGYALPGTQLHITIVPTE